MDESYPEIENGLSVPKPQGESKEKFPQLPTANLEKFKEIIGRYHAIQTHPELVNRDEIDEVFTRRNLPPQDVISPSGLGYRLNEEKLTAFLGGVFEEKRNSLNANFTPDEIEEQLVSAEKDFKDLHLLELFLNQTISPEDKEKSADLLKLAHKTAALSQAVFLHQIAKKGIDLFREDALARTNLPVRYKETAPEIPGQPQQEGLILHDLKQLAFVTADPALQQQYNILLHLLEKDEFDCCHYFGDGISWPLFQTKVSAVPVNRAIDNMCRFFTFSEKDEWDKIEAIPEQVRSLYDVVEKRFFEHLSTDDSVSTRTTRIVLFFSKLRDPRAIPGLIIFLGEAGSWVNRDTLAQTISKITKEPLSSGDLEKVLAGLPSLEKRIINDWFINPSPAIKEALEWCSSQSMANCINNPEPHLIYEELVNLAAQAAITSKEKLDPEVSASYFLGDFAEWRETEQIDRLLVRDLSQTAPIIAKSKLTEWRTATPILFKALVNPENRDYFFFPGLIAREGLTLNSGLTDKLELLYQSKDLQKGVYARTSFAEGLLFLSSKENGREILESILTVTRGTREDPARIREIFQWMRSLDAFGVFGFEAKGSLNEIIADLKEKMVQEAKTRMELGEEDLPSLKERLPYLLENRTFEIIPALLAQYEIRSDNTKNVIREIGRHIILGDFKNWRNSLPASEAQLAVLSDEKRQAWLEPADELRVTIKMQKQEEARIGAVEAIKRIVQESKAHIAEVYKLDFSQDRIRVLQMTRGQLVKDLKDQTQDAEVKRELGTRKRSVDLELQILEGMTGLESLSPDQLQPIKILEIISKTKNALNSFGGLEQAQQDLDQISQVLTTQKELASVEELKAYDSDDPFALLNIGVEPRETCQSWRRGSHNYCLPAYVADANKRVINIEGNNKEILARSVIKLTHLQGENNQKIPAILLEPIYTTSELPQIYQVVVRMALAKARATGAVLVVSGEQMVASGSDHSHTIPLLSTEAKKNGFHYEIKDVQIFIPQSFNPHEYSDSLWGDISWFENYHPLKNAVIVTPSQYGP